MSVDVLVHYWEYYWQSGTASVLGCTECWDVLGGALIPRQWMLGPTASRIKAAARIRANRDAALGDGGA
jgi:hypothetical protein